MKKTDSDIQVIQMPTNDLLSSFDPENPRDHDTGDGGDVVRNAISLLEAGWVEIGVAYNANLQRLTGGHGRVMAADWLRNQSGDWFEDRWEKWLARNPDGRPGLAELHKPRFNPSYWNQCPAKISQLDEATHRAMLIRLNNTAVEGTDNSAKMAALLSKIPKQGDELAGWEASTKNAFMSAFLVKKKEAKEVEAAAEAEFEGKQVFERPDATDYSVRDPAYPSDSSGLSSEVRSNFDEEWGDFGESDEPPEFRAADGSIVQSAEVSLDVSDFRVDDVVYDSNIRETRAVLLYSREQLAEFKSLAPKIGHIIQKLGYELDTVSRSIKLWRPDAVLLLMQHVAKEKESLLADYEEIKGTKDADSESVTA